MKSQAKIVVAVLSIALIARAQSSAPNQAPEPQVELSQYWVDPSTGLMWTARDNGKAVTWHKADSYCRKLRLVGYRDWRLATLDELASLVDTPAPVRDSDSKIVDLPIRGHVKGSLTLTGDSWSSNRVLDRFGHPYGPGFFFDFRQSKPSYDLQLFRNTKYALCVRKP
jgi:hypothetical protein